MKRWVYFLIGFLVLFGIGVVVARSTGALTYFKAASGANEPAFSPGDKFFISNLKSPKLFDFICYESKDNVDVNKKIIAMHRLCGLPGDEIKIVDGDLYVNGKLADSSLNLIHSYFISLPDYGKIMEKLPENQFAEKRNDSIRVDIPTDLLKLHKIPAVRVFLDSTYVDEGIKLKFNQQWNVDQFGPVKVPPMSFFVMGDNRNSSYDSRYIGFIPKSALVGVVLR